MVLLFFMNLLVGCLFVKVNGFTVQLSQPSLLTTVDSTVLVDCLTTPKEDVNVRWEKSGKSIPLQPASGTEPEVFYMPNNTLKITKIKRRHTGKYICIATYNNEDRLADFSVEIKYIQQIDDMNPVVVYSGVTAEMSCIPPNGKPVPKPLWLKNGKTFDNVRIDQSSFILKIKNADPTDTANYTCVAIGFKNRTTTASLTVYKKEIFEVTPKSSNITEGETALFTCNSKTEPPLPLHWVKISRDCEGDQQCKESTQPVVDIDKVRFTVSTITGVLTINSVTPEDAGEYSCVRTLGMEYESKTVRLNVLALIKISLKPTLSIDMDSKTKHIVDCPFRGDNPKSFKWLRTDTGTLPKHMSTNGSKLIIDGALLTDSATYTCSITGPLNTDTATVNLTIYRGLKFIKKPSNVTGFVSKPLWIDCTGSGYPKPAIHYFRIKDRAGALDSTHFKEYDNGTLYIASVKTEDQGTYMCFLKSKPGGTKTAQFRLTVQTGGIGKSGSSTMHRTIAIAVGCAAVYILLVIGLMIYCRARRARLLKGIITEVDGEGKDPLINNGTSTDIPMGAIDKKKVDKWEFGREKLTELATLGHGKMGRVYKANADGIREGEKRTLVAVKEFNTIEEKEHAEEFNTELEMFTQLDHENVVRLLGICTSKEETSVPWLLITDFGEEGDLKIYLNRNKDLDVDDRLGMSICVANGMDYLIQRHYIHRDLAARNCLVRSNKSVVVSFLSLCEDTYQEDYVGLNDVPVPVRWLSPESIQEERYSEKSDVWSFGVTLWEIFSGGERPYAAFTDDDIVKGVPLDLRLTKPKACPVEVFEIVKGCWENKPDERPAFVELKTNLIGVKLE